MAYGLKVSSCDPLNKEYKEWMVWFLFLHAKVDIP